MGNNNDYVGEVILSKDVTSLMRRINALEAEVAENIVPPILDDFVIIGADAYMLCRDTNKVYKFTVSGWTKTAAFSLPALADPLTDNYQSITTDGTFLFVSVNILGAGNGGVYKLDTSGTALAFISMPGVGKIQYANDSIYGLRGIYNNTSYTQAISRYALDGTMVFDVFGLAFSNLAISGNTMYVAKTSYLPYLSSKYSSISGEYLSSFALLGGTGFVTFVPDIIDGNYLYRCAQSLGWITKYDLTTQRAVSNTYYPQHYSYVDVVKQMVIDSGNLCILLSTGGPLNYSMQVSTIDLATMTETSIDTLDTIDTFVQTKWYGYGSTQKWYLGDPDGGVTIPALNALSDNNQIVFAARHIIDMRGAIQRIAPYYNNIPLHPYTWTDSDEDNLYRVAMYLRDAWGATGGAKYDWTRDEEAMIDTALYDIDIGEIQKCVEQLEGSTLA